MRIFSLFLVASAVLAVSGPQPRNSFFVELAGNGRFISYNYERLTPGTGLRIGVSLLPEIRTSLYLVVRRLVLKAG
jgi:hypothetical protein